MEDEKQQPDFSGWATKTGLKCSDGRMIMSNAFAHQDGVTVPLVWSHGHNDPELVLGHAVLTNVEGEGVRCDAFFNDGTKGVASKKLVEHGDVESLSIWANDLIEKVVSGAKQVFHGAIKEVSLVLAGANPGAKIDFVRVAHSDDPEDYTDLPDVAIIHTGLPIEYSENPDAVAAPGADEAAEEEHNQEGEGSDDPDLDFGEDNPDLKHAAAVSEDTNLAEIYEGMTEEQQNLTDYLVQTALETVASNTASAAHADNNDEDDHLAHQEGSNMTQHKNVFEMNGDALDNGGKRQRLSHAQINEIMVDAKKPGSTLKESVLSHVQDYGIEDIDVLFPDAKAVMSQPELIARRTEWVAGIIDGAKHQPFARIKSLAADLTDEQARAKGYVKAGLKKEEVIKLLKRVTTPTMIYKKQKLDRQDIIDITDFDVVAWLKWEMRFMLEEEIARAILIGDGREPDDDDKIDEDCLRPIAWDVDMYNTTITLPTEVSPEDMVEAIIRARKSYKGTGRPTFYTNDDIITDMLLIKDKMGRYVYDDEQALANKLRVTALVPVEVMEEQPDLLGIMVNINDYTIGADKGGEISMFDDFDIDYNQEKYLIETYISGALTKPKSAVTIKRTSGTTVTPTAPSYNSSTHVITFPSITGVNYQVGGVTKTGTLTISATTDVEAVPASGYNFPHGLDTDWTFVYTA